MTVMTDGRADLWIAMESAPRVMNASGEFGFTVGRLREAQPPGQVEVQIEAEVQDIKEVIGFDFWHRLQVLPLLAGVYKLSVS